MSPWLTISLCKIGGYDNDTQCTLLHERNTGDQGQDTQSHLRESMTPAWLFFSYDPLLVWEYCNLVYPHTVLVKQGTAHSAFLFLLWPVMHRDIYISILPIGEGDFLIQKRRKYKNVNNSVQITWNKMKQNFFMCIARHNNVYFSSMHAQRFFCFYCSNHYHNALISTLLSGFCLICTHACKTLTNQRRFKIKSL